MLSSFCSGDASNAKIMWMVPSVCCLSSSGDVRSCVCVYIQQTCSLLVLNCVCELQICLLRVRKLGKNEVIVHNKSPICFSSALQPTRETFPRELLYNLHSYCQNWEMKHRYGMRNVHFKWKKNRNWDITGWKTNLKFIKSTISKGGETRGKDKRRFTHSMFFTAIHSICVISQVLN